MTPVWRQKGGIRGDKAKVPPPLRVTGLIGARQRPTLPPGYPDSTIGAGGLNFRVRKGNGCLPSAIVTERAELYRLPGRGLRLEPVEHPVEADGVDGLFEQVDHVALSA